MSSDADKKATDHAAGDESLLQAERMGIVQEFWLFLMENKAYWLAPIIIVALLLIGLIVAGGAGGGAAVFISLSRLLRKADNRAVTGCLCQAAGCNRSGSFCSDPGQLTRNQACQ